MLQLLGLPLNLRAFLALLLPMQPPELLFQLQPLLLRVLGLCLESLVLSSLFL
jgi:hypothetical protein